MDNLVAIILATVAIIWQLGHIVIRLTALVIIPRRQQPTSAMSWLVLIMFLPWLGLIIYLFVGENRLPKRRLKHHARILKELETFNQELTTSSQIVHPDLSMEMEPVVKLAESLGQMPILGGNDAKVIAGYVEIIDRLIEDIDRAQHHVHLEYYIFADDEQGRRVYDALVRAVERGVKCRVLIDDFGAKAFLKKLDVEMTKHGIDVYRMLPAKLLRFYAHRLDLRNHRKIAVIDGQIGYTGSQNIVNADYNYGVDGLTYEELMVRLTGPIVLELQAVFAGDWYFETEELLSREALFPAPIIEPGTIMAQTLPSGPTYDMENFQRLVINMLYAAKNHIIITTPYFIPDQYFLHAVQTASLRGVEIEIIVSRRDQVLVGLGQSAFYKELLEAGIKLHKYSKALLHAKHMTVDNELAMIGSSNMDVRSLSLNFEVNVLFYGPEIVEMLKKEQRRYIEDSVPITLEEWEQRPKLQRIAQDLAKLASPLL
jgi:cardiolipin synthase